MIETVIETVTKTNAVEQNSPHETEAITPPQVSSFLLLLSKRLGRLGGAQTLTALIAMLSVISAEVFASPPPLPRDGLIMHMDATSGVETKGQIITNWWDQSGHGQNLRANANVKLISRGLNNKPVVALTGAADQLTQSSSSKLPIYDNDRTLIALTATRNTDVRLGYGASGCGASFGLGQDSNGYTSLLQGCNDGTLFAQGKVSSGDWNLHVLLLRSGRFIHLRNGQLVDGRDTRFTTRPGPFEIRLPNLGENDRAELRIATIMGYNWALGTTELLKLQRYLGSKWFNNSEYFNEPPDVQRIELPKPKLQLSQKTINGHQKELSWRVSFADECGAENGWTSARGTSGKEIVSQSYNGENYTLNCWHAAASATDRFHLADTKPVRITWRASADQTDATTGYRLFVGTRSRQYETVVEVSANPTNSHTLELEPGQYYVAMSTIGVGGQESGLSGELAISVN